MTSPNLEKKLAEEPIIIPASPFWESLRIFGRDQLITMTINVGGTAAIAPFINNQLLLSIAGPIIEKVGFFIAYFREALAIYRTTPPSQRSGPAKYIANAFKKGLASMIKDIAAHDPLYAVFMFIGLNTYPETPAWILSVASFIGSLGIVVAGEVIVNEVRYYLQIAGYKRAGFKLESYLESRFYVKNTEPLKVLDDLSSKFNLTRPASAKYHDKYFETNLENYNGRKPVLRFRERTQETGNGQNRTIQIVFTRASQMPRERLGQFNYYPTRKDKLWIKIKGEIPQKIEDIPDTKVRNICRKIITGNRQDVFFSREVIRNPKNILVSVDEVRLGESPFTMVEIKSHLDDKSRKMLLEAMRYIMFRYEVIQTTHDKSILTSPEFE